MAVAEIQDLKQYCLDVARRARAASEALAQAGGQKKIDWLRLVGEAASRACGRGHFGKRR